MTEKDEMAHGERLCFLAEDEALITAAVDVVRCLQDAGYTAYFAGGCVRDTLLGRVVKDVDIATDAVPEAIEALFPGKTVGVGKAFGVMLVQQGGFSFDVATFRTDGGYQDGRHPQSVAFSSAEHDALRRDFTINGMFYDPVAGMIYDFVGGCADLKKKTVRTIGNAGLRFEEDRLRMMRAVRFACVLEFEIEAATSAAIFRHASALGVVSIERIVAEFIRTLCEMPGKPSRALDLFDASGLLAQFFPELGALHGCLQDPVWHPEGDVWVHTALMLDFLDAPRDPALVWSVLLHDIAKPACLEVGVKPDGSPWYRTPRHAKVGAEMAETILRRFKQPLALIEQVTVAVSHHMQFVELPKMQGGTLRRVLGRKTIPLELELHRLDCLASHGKLDLYELAKETLDSFRNEPVLPDPVVSGRDLLALGFEPSPAIGAILKRLYTAQLEGAFSDLADGIDYFMNREPRFDLEAIALSAEDVAAVNASEASAVELCAAIEEGGLTPDRALVVSLGEGRCPVRVMVRPTSRDFVYTSAEFSEMLAAIDFFRGLSGIEGIVVGILTAENTVDTARMRDVMAHAGHLKVTFHRAFESVADPEAAYGALARLGVDAILTSLPEALPARCLSGPVKLRIGGGLRPAALAALREKGLMRIHMGRAVRVGQSYAGGIDPAIIRKIIRY